MLTAAKSGERAAFADLMRRHSAIAHRTAVLLGAGPDADDVVQEAFVKAYRALSTVRDGSPFRPWLLRIVANETFNLHRSARRRLQRERTAHDTLPTLPPLSHAMDPIETTLHRERQEFLRGQLLALPEPQRRVLICRYLLDLDEAETAVVLGIAHGTVKSRTHRALRALRASLPADRSGGTP